MGASEHRRPASSSRQLPRVDGADAAGDVAVVAVGGWAVGGVAGSADSAQREAMGSVAGGVDPEPLGGVEIDVDDAPDATAKFAALRARDRTVERQRFLDSQLHKRVALKQADEEGRWRGDGGNVARAEELLSQMLDLEKKRYFKARLSKLRRLIGEKDELEQKWRALRSKNREKTGEVMRMSVQVARAHGELVEARRQSEAGRKKLNKFEARLKRAVGVARLLPVYEARVEHLVRQLDEKEARLNFAKGQVLSKLQSAMVRRDDARHRHELLVKAINANEATERSIAEEIMRIRSEIASNKQDLSAAHQMESQTKLRVETIEHEVSMERTRHADAVSDIESKAKEMDDAKEAAARAIKEKKAAMEAKKRQLSEMFAKCNELRKGEGHDTFPEPKWGEEQPPSLDVARVRVRVAAEEKALEAKKAERDALRKDVADLDATIASNAAKAAGKRAEAEALMKEAAAAREVEAQRKADMEKMVAEADVECAEVEKLRASIGELTATKEAIARETTSKLQRHDSDVSTMDAEIATTIAEIAAVEKARRERVEREAGEDLELEDFDVVNEPMCHECNTCCVRASTHDRRECREQAIAASSNAAAHAFRQARLAGIATARQAICCDDETTFSDASTTTSIDMSLCTDGSDEQNQLITCCGHIGCPDPTSPVSDLTECDACQNWHCEDYCEEECAANGCDARLCRSCMDGGGGLCLGCRLFCDICQDFCCFRGDQLVQCCECSKLVCSNCLDEDDGDGDDAPVCTECCEDVAAPAALGLIETLEKQYSGISFHSGSGGWVGKQTGTYAGCGRKQLETAMYGTLAGAALALSAHQYALGLAGGSRHGDTLGVQPVLNISVDDFEARWKRERIQLRALHSYSAKAKKKKDMRVGSTLSDVVQMVIDDLNRKLKKSWPHNAAARRETLNCLKEIIAGRSRSFCWNDLPAPRPHDSVLNVDEDSFPVYYQALVYFFCQEKKDEMIKPERFERKADYSDERNKKLFRDCADHGADAVFEMCLVDPRYRADFLLLLAEHPGDPRKLPVEQKKKVVHRFLKSIGVVPKTYTPIFCKQRDDLHDGNATKEECKPMVAKLGLAFHAEMDRINKELEDAERECTAIEEHLKEGRRITRLLLPAFAFINKYLTTGKPGISFDKFAKEFMRLVHVVPELRRLQLEDMTDLTRAVWNNSDPKLSDKTMQRCNKLAELKQDLLWYANGGKCFYHGCERHIGDYPPSARRALHLHHPNGKSVDPKKLAMRRNLDLPNEHLDEEKGLANACPFHHDHGEKRKYELSLLAHVCKLRNEPSRRDQHRSTEEIFADHVMALKFVCYIIESHVRGTTSGAFACYAMTNRFVMDAYFSRPSARGYSNIVLWDDMSRLTAGQFNNGDGSGRLREFQFVLMNLLTFEGYCCVSANEKASQEAEAKSEEELTEHDFACKSGDYDFRNLAPFEYYAVHGDHLDRKKKNYKPSELAGKNLFDLLDETLVFRYTVSFSHSIKTRQENRGKELCYHHALH